MTPITIRILVVEDAPAVINDFLMFYSNKATWTRDFPDVRFDVTIAKSFASGLALSHQHWDIVFLDNRLPDVDAHWSTDSRFSSFVEPVGYKLIPAFKQQGCFVIGTSSDDVKGAHPGYDRHHDKSGSNGVDAWDDRQAITMYILSKLQ